MRFVVDLVKKRNGIKCSTNIQIIFLINVMRFVRGRPFKKRHEIRGRPCEQRHGTTCSTNIYSNNILNKCYEIRGRLCKQLHGTTCSTNIYSNNILNKCYEVRGRPCKQRHGTNEVQTHIQIIF